MTTFRTAADDPAQDRRPASLDGFDRMPPRRATPEPAPADTLPATDPVAARLQARLEAIEASPEAVEPMRRRSPRLPAPVAGDHLDVIADLNQQLDVLRDQLETAFDDSDRRIAAAQAAADAAQARMVDVSEALNQLAAELPHLVTPGRGEELRQALSRLRARLAPR
jgi:hypothetical protein